MLTEEKWELLYYLALESKCPLESRKTRSLSRLAIKGIEETITQFSQLNFYKEKLINYCKNKNYSLCDLDCETYLAWKIWQYKLENIETRIINKYCRCKAQIIAQKALTEFHKSASRIKRNFNQLELCCMNNFWLLFSL